MTVAGTIGASEPTWAAFTNAGATTTDNAATWVTIATIPSGFGVLAAPHARLPLATTATWGQSGNTFFMADNSAETSAAAVTTTPPSTVALPAAVLSFDHTVGAVPPTAVTAGASISVGAANQAMTLQGTTVWWEGITFNGGTTGNSAGISINAGGTGTYHMFKNCGFFLRTSGTAAITIGLATNVIELDGTNITFGGSNAAASVVFTGSMIRFRNMSFLVTGTQPTQTFDVSTVRGSNIFFEGVDFTAITGATSVQPSAGPVNVNVIYRGCAFRTGATLGPTPTGQGAIGWVDVIESDTAAGNKGFRFDRYRYQGTITTETSIVRTGGASSIGNTAYSWKLVTTANNKWAQPMEFPKLGARNTSTASVTVTIEGTINSASLPNTDDIWIEVEYPGSSSSTLATLVNSTKASYLASGTPLSSSAKAWGGGGSGAGWSPFVLTKTFTPAVAGPIYVRVKSGKASATYYIDPIITLS